MVFHAERLENKLASGLPDIHWVNQDRKAGFVELKVHVLGTKTGVRPDQALWMRRYKAAGGRVGVLSRDPNTRLWTWYPAGTSYAWVKDIQEGKCVGLTSPFLINLQPVIVEG